MPNEIPVVFHNDSNYVHHFSIKKLANEFEGKFECLGENSENHKNFFHSNTRKDTNIDKDGNENVVTISYKIKFIDSARNMASSNLADNLAEGNHKIKFKVVIVFWNMKVSMTI